MRKKNSPTNLAIKLYICDSDVAMTTQRGGCNPFFKNMIFKKIGLILLKLITEMLSPASGVFLVNPFWISNQYDYWGLELFFTIVHVIFTLRIILPFDCFLISVKEKQVMVKNLKQLKFLLDDILQFTIFANFLASSKPLKAKLT